MRTLALLCVVAASAASLAGEAAHAAPAKAAPAYRAPRTAFGAPDLQGLWTNTALTFLQRPPIFKALIATDKEEAMLIGGFKKMVGNALSNDPIDPKLPAPPEVKEALWSALCSLASAPSEERTLTGLSVLLQSNALKSALMPIRSTAPSDGCSTPLRTGWRSPTYSASKPRS